MKIADLKPGDVIAVTPYGYREKDVRDGRECDVVYVLATGKYTEGRGPCGPMALPYVHGEPKAVVARRRRYRDDEWECRVMGARQLIMYHSEFRVKNGPVRKLQRDINRHRKEGERLRQAVIAEAAKLYDDGKLIGKVTSIYFYDEGRYRREPPHVSITREIPVSKLESYKALKEWEALPDPSECKL